MESVRHRALLGPALPGARARGPVAAGPVRAPVRPAQQDRSHRHRSACSKPHRCGGIQPVPVKTVEQQTLQALHRVRTQWQAARTARINVMRGLLREQGLPVPVGARTVADPRRDRAPRRPGPRAARSAAPHRRALVVDEVRALEARVAAIDRQLARVARAHPVAPPAAAGAGRRRPHRHRDGRRGQSHSRLSSRPRLRQLARADPTRIVDRRPPLSRARSANAATATCGAC